MKILILILSILLSACADQDTRLCGETSNVEINICFDGYRYKSLDCSHKTTSYANSFHRKVFVLQYDEFKRPIKCAESHNTNNNDSNVNSNSIIINNTNIIKKDSVK